MLGKRPRPDRPSPWPNNGRGLPCRGQGRSKGGGGRGEGPRPLPVPGTRACMIARPGTARRPPSLERPSRHTCAEVGRGLEPGTKAPYLQSGHTQCVLHNPSPGDGHSKARTSKCGENGALPRRVGTTATPADGPRGHDKRWHALPGAFGRAPGARAAGRPWAGCVPLRSRAGGSSKASRSKKRSRRPENRSVCR